MESPVELAAKPPRAAESRSPRLSRILLLISAICALGGWAAVEAGFLLAYAPDGFLASHWSWRFLPLRWPPLAALVFLGLLTFAAIHLLPGILKALGGRTKGNPRGRSVSGFSGPARLTIPFSAIWLVALLVQIVPDGRYAIASTLLVTLGGRLTVAALLWQQLGIGPALYRLFRTPVKRRTWATLLAVLGIAPALLLNDIAPAPTGDEPSFLQMSYSIMHDFDVQFTESELRKAARLFSLPEGMRPHMVGTVEAPIPQHFLGPALAVLPAVAVGELLNSPVQACRIFMLLVFGATVAIVAELSRRLVGSPVAAATAAVIFAASFPAIGMSFQIYPDPFAALFVAGSLLALSPALIGPKRLEKTNLAVVVASILLLPWFHPKFTLLSAALTLLLLIVGKPSRPLLLRLTGILTVGGIVFLAVNYAIFRHILWSQDSVGTVRDGLVGMLVDNNNGLLAYVPWVLLLPAGALAISPSMRRKVVGAVLALSLPLYLVTGLTQSWSTGGDAALRYLLPCAVTWVPLLAAAIVLFSRRSAFVPAVLAMFPLLMIPVFLSDPVSSYSAHAQVGRVILDQTIDSVSWRELFPHFRYPTGGVDRPGSLWPHALAVLAASAVFAAILCSRLVRDPVRMLAAALLLLTWFVFTARLFQNPDWAVTGTKMFLQHARSFEAMEKTREKAFNRAFSKSATPSHPGLILDLPAALRPIVSESRHPEGNALRFSATLPEGMAVMGPRLQLPPGEYDFQVWGRVLDSDPATSPAIAARIFTTPPGSPNLLLEVPVMEQTEALTPNSTSAVLLKETFRSAGDRVYDVVVTRKGAVDFLYDRLQIRYLGK